MALKTERRRQVRPIVRINLIAYAGLFDVGERPWKEPEMMAVPLTVRGRQVWGKKEELDFWTR